MMFARLTAKAVLAAIAIALAFCGICLLGMALATAMVAWLGHIGGYVVAGLVLLVPPLVWAVVTHLSQPKKPAAQTGSSELIKVFMTAIAKETPWIAIIGTGLVGVANMFLNRNKSSK